MYVCMYTCIHIYIYRFHPPDPPWFLGGVQKNEGQGLVTHAREYWLELCPGPRDPGTDGVAGVLGSLETFGGKLWWYNYTWWLIPLSKWFITPVASGITLLIPFITEVKTYLLSGMIHQVIWGYTQLIYGSDIDDKFVGYIWLYTIYVNLYRIIFWQFRWRNLWYPNGPSPIVVPMFLHQTPKKWRWLDIPCLAKTIHCTSGNFQRGFSPPPSRCQIGWEIWRKPWWISTQNVFVQDFLLTITFNHMVKNEK